MRSNNNIVINDKVSLPFPFGMNRALPIDSRSFFSNMEEALEAVHDAVYLQTDGHGNFVLPSEEEGGVDSPYYFGEPVIVVSDNGESAQAYVVVKKYDEDDEPYGDLEPVNYNLLSQYLNESQVAELSELMIERYISENLNVDCIDDYLFTSERDDCGNEVPANGLYAYGLKEVNGKIELCDYARKILAFDPATLYDEYTNPLATVDTVKRSLAKFMEYVIKELNKKVDKVPGYGLSQNDFTDCLLDKLTNLPYISIEGNKLTINGKPFMLNEWFEVFDYYIGWMTLRKRSRFIELTREELLNAVKDTGNVPSLGKLYGPSAACGYNTFFVMKRKYLTIDKAYRGEYSELHSEGIASRIRTDLPAVMHHADVMINDVFYDVYGLHTYHPNPSDTIQIAFGYDTYDYYIGWITLKRRSQFYTLTKNEIMECIKDSGDVPPEGKLYGPDSANGYNTFIIIKRKHITIDSPVDGEFSEWFSNGIPSPVRSYLDSTMKHADIDISNITYDVYGLYTNYPNPLDTVQVAFGMGDYDYYIGWGNVNGRTDFLRMGVEELVSDAVPGNVGESGTVYSRNFNDNNLFYVVYRENVILGNHSFLESGDSSYDRISSPMYEGTHAMEGHANVTMNGVTYKVRGLFTHYQNQTDKVTIQFLK
ncbi:MAG: hypothetical protein J6X18_06485 [Bacteroidales bacterium]|nr:hypothetical protein [Bacteroidales bacterium]